VTLPTIASEVRRQGVLVAQAGLADGIDAWIEVQNAELWADVE